MLQYDGRIPDRTFLFRRVMPKPVASKLVLALQQVVTLRYRAQDGVGLQQALLRRHELIVAGGQKTIVADGRRRGLPVDGDGCGARTHGGQQRTPEDDQGGERDAEQNDQRPAAAQDSGVKNERALGFSGIAQPGVRLRYRNRTGHGISSVLAVALARLSICRAAARKMALGPAQ